jgi:hypothetical protein
MLPLVLLALVLARCACYLVCSPTRHPPPAHSPTRPSPLLFICLFVRSSGIWQTWRLNGHVLSPKSHQTGPQTVVPHSTSHSPYHPLQSDTTATSIILPTQTHTPAPRHTPITSTRRPTNLPTHPLTHSLNLRRLLDVFFERNKYVALAQVHRRAVRSALPSGHFFGGDITAGGAGGLCVTSARPRTTLNRFSSLGSSTLLGTASSVMSRQSTENAPPR